MLRRSTIFSNLNSARPNRFTETILTSSEKIYRIDDCDVNITVKGIDQTAKFNELKDFYSVRGFNKIIDNYLDTIGTELPIMTHEEYLRELKDTVIENNTINLGNLTRLIVPTLPNVYVANVLIKDKYPSAYCLINEVYVHEKYMETLK